MISPDGKWLAYQSDESKKDEVYVQPFPDAGRKWLVSTDSGSAPVWSKTENVLFYSSAEGIIAVSYKTRGGEFVADRPTLRAPCKNMYPWFDVSADGKHFAIVQDATEGQRASSHVNFLLNFAGELRRRVP